MPCCDPTPYYHYESDCNKTKSSSKQVDSLNKKLASLGKQYNELKERADKLTQLLCYACGTFKHEDMLCNLDYRLIEWWNEHDAWDFERTLETMKKTFADSLTDKTAIREWFIRQAKDVHPLSCYHCNEYFDRVYAAFVDWQNNVKNREKQIAELEAELAKLKAEA